MGQTDMARILRAAEFAALKHREQRRKDPASSPYINHPLNVAAVLADAGGVEDADLLIAAILHDTVEDTQTTPAELRAHFGDAVEHLVAEVTDDKSLPKEKRKELQVAHAPHKSDAAKQLKLADKICNVRDMTDDSPAGWPPARKVQYLDWATKVISGCRGVNPELERLFDEEMAAARGRLGG